MGPSLLSTCSPFPIIIIVTFTEVVGGLIFDGSILWAFLSFISMQRAHSWSNVPGVPRQQALVTG